MIKKIDATLTQKRFWLEWKLAPQSLAYNTPLLFNITGELDISALTKALEQLILDNECFRTYFVEENNNLQQVILKKIKWTLDYKIFSNPKQSFYAGEFSQSILEYNFDLTQAPLFKFALLEYPQKDYILLLNFHHIIMDGLTGSTIIDELSDYYNQHKIGKFNFEEARRPSFVDYHTYENEHYSIDKIENDLLYWENLLKGSSCYIDFIHTHPHESIFANAIYFNINKNTTQLLKAFAHTEKSTLFNIIASLYGILLYRYINQKEFSLSYPVNLRPKVFNSILGCFANNIPLKINLTGINSFRDVLQQLTAQRILSREHQECSFTDIIERLRKTGVLETGQKPFNVGIAATYLRSRKLDFIGVDVSAILQTHFPAIYDLSLEYEESKDELLFRVNYRESLFEESFMKQFCEHFKLLTSHCINNPEKSFKELCLLSSTEQQQILNWSENNFKKIHIEGLTFGNATKLYVLDDYLNLTPIGVVGTLYISEELFSDKLSFQDLIENPFNKQPGKYLKLHNSGRLARWLSDGSLDYLGHTNHFTWIEGHCFELHEIEQVLLKHQAIAACVVLAQAPSTVMHKQSIAYIVTRHQINDVELKRFLTAESISQSLHPTDFIRVNVLPYQLNGMLDLKALLKLPIINSQIAMKWEAVLNSLPGIRQAGVIIQDKIKNEKLLHLGDILTNFQNANSLILNQPTLKPTSSSEAAPNKLAISYGGNFNPPSDSVLTLSKALQNAAIMAPEKGMIYIKENNIEVFQTYPQLLEKAKQILTGLQHNCLKPNDKVILQLDQYDIYIPTLWACILGGIIPVTIAIPHSYKEKSGVTSKLYNIWELLDHPPILVTEFISEKIIDLKNVYSMQEMQLIQIDKFEHLTPTTEIYPAKPSDPVFFQLTSGSTGIPKCIIETHANIIYHIQASQKFNDYNADDITLNWLPFDHVVPILTVHMKSVYLCQNGIHVNPQTILVNPEKWLDLIEKHRVTHTWSPNFGFKLVTECLSDMPQRYWDLSSIKFFMNAGEQVTLNVVKNFLEALSSFGITPKNMQPSFGMAESATCMTYNNDFNFTDSVYHIEKKSLNGKLKRIYESSNATTTFIDLGPPMPGVDIKIVDADYNILPEGVIGRFHIKGRVLSGGYYKNDKANKEAFLEDAWLNSGDLGFIWNGRLILTGREKETIIIRGANFYCYEIEDVVNQVSGVEPTYVASCSISSEQSGTEELAIFFVSKLEINDDPINIIRDIRSKLTSALGISPLYVIPLDKVDFPKTTSGKIQRVQLKKLLLEGFFSKSIKKIEIGLKNNNTIPNWFYEKSWRRKEFQNLIKLDRVTSYLIFTDELGLGSSIMTKLKKQNPNFHCVIVETGSVYQKINSDYYRIDPLNTHDYQTLLTELSIEGTFPQRILHCWTFNNNEHEVITLETIEKNQDIGLYSVLFLAQALAKSARPIFLTVISNHSQQVFQHEKISPSKTSLFGLLKTIPQELPWLTCRHVDLDSDTVDTHAELIVKEISMPYDDPEIAYRNSQRWSSYLQQIDLSNKKIQPTLFKKGGYYILSGGLGGIGYEVAKYLLKNYHAKLLLIGRKILPPVSTWSQHLLEESSDAELIQYYAALLTISKDVYYETVDINDLQLLKDVISKIKQNNNVPIDGVIHLAGSFIECEIIDETKTHFSNILKAKMSGSWNLKQILQEENPCGLFLAMGSVNGYFGGRKVSAYSAANSYLENFSHYLNQTSSLSSYCLSWSLWDGIGISRQGQYKQFAQARGFHAISVERGLASLEIALTYHCKNLLIGLDNTKKDVELVSEIITQNEQALYAYYTIKDEDIHQDEFNSIKISDKLSRPTECKFIKIDHMPIKEDGIIDKTSLAKLQGDSVKATEFIPPTNDIETLLANIITKELNLERVSIHDNFFDIGGNSLSLVRAHADLVAALKREILIIEFFNHPTIYDLAKYLSSDSEETTTLVDSRDRSQKRLQALRQIRKRT